MSFYRKRLIEDLHKLKHISDDLLRAATHNHDELSEETEKFLLEKLDKLNDISYTVGYNILRHPNKKEK